MTKKCDFCQQPETPDNPIGVYRINAGAWGHVCEHCKMMHESNGGFVEKGAFLSETMPIENNTGLQSI